MATAAFKSSAFTIMALLSPFRAVALAFRSNEKVPHWVDYLHDTQS